MQEKSGNSVVEQMLRRVPQDSDLERSQAMRQVMAAAVPPGHGGGVFRPGD